MENSQINAIEIFKKAGGTLRMTEAVKQGVHWRVLYHLRDIGQLEVLSRGLYRLQDQSEPNHLDLLTVARRIPKGVVCLISALDFHEITTQIPHFVYVALPYKSHKPSIDYPPIRHFWYADKYLKTGVVEHTMDGCSVKIFDTEKTLVDCVRYRNKIGMNIVLEALKTYLSRRNFDLEKLLGYAKQLRADKILRPIVQTILAD